MKKYDEFGIPVGDGYDYSQHILNSNEGEVKKKISFHLIKYKWKVNFLYSNISYFYFLLQVVAVFNTEIKVPLNLEPDIDYKVEEMNEEQKEVFQALGDNIKEGEYEDLEDNFVELAMQGEKCIIEDLNDKKANKIPDYQSKQKETEAVSKKIPEILD